MNNTSKPVFFKYLAVILIWGITTIVALVQLLRLPNSFGLIVMIVLLGMALGATRIILNDSEGNSQSGALNKGDKRKNDQAGGLTPDMLALLDEDDIADLRRRLKNRLIERIEGGSDGELSSLDALLADQEQPRKNRH